jgi:hypothetical protein
VPDPFAHDVESDYRHGDAILLNYQTGLTVDRTLQNRQVGYAAADIDDQCATCSPPSMGGARR